MLARTGSIRQRHADLGVSHTGFTSADSLLVASGQSGGFPQKRRVSRLAEGVLPQIVQETHWREWVPNLLPIRSHDGKSDVGAALETVFKVENTPALDRG